MRWLLLALLVGCVPTSEIGPYVKSVARNGPYLAVQKCTIVLEGDELREGTCAWENVPLGSLPMPPAMQPR